MAKKAQNGKGAPKRPKSAASMEAAWRAVEEIKPNPRNVRLHSSEQVAKIQASLRQFGQVWPILIDGDGMIVAHHGVFEACKAEGYEEVKVTYIEGLSEDQARAFVVADNRLAEISTWDEAALKAELEALQSLDLEMDSVGYAADEITQLLANTDEAERQMEAGTLARQFGVPPFTILNAKSGDWQKRKDGWTALGIRSEEGRGQNLLKFSDSVRLDGDAYNANFKNQSKGAK